MNSPAIHPFFLLMSMVGIAGGLYSLYEHNPAALPIVFGLSLLALILRAWQLSSESDRGKKPAGSIDFGALRQMDLLRYADWLKENVRGQDEVVELVVKKISQGLGLAGPNRLLGSFMLVGPTGTGKTFLSELVAKALYPESETVILRMNQYKDKHDVFTLLGPPPGQPGYEVGGALTRPVLDNPYRVIVLDEIDKCHLDVQHCLYDILDSAQCREKSSGKTVTFSACVIFATCNAGVEELREVQRSMTEPARRIGRFRDALSKAAGFDKALLARFNEILLMDELSPIHVAEVACLQLVKHWRQYGIEVTYASPEILVEAMRKNAEFREYGVRQLANFIQSLTDSSIEEAKRNGASRVRLEIDRSTGQITIA